MKRCLQFSVLFFALLVIAGQAQASSWLDAVNKAADELLRVQNDDGSYDWAYDGDPSKGFADNTQGATGRGLVAAYCVTGKHDYLMAANRVANKLYTYHSDNSRSRMFNKDIEFFYELAAAGGEDYTNLAQNKAVSYISQKMGDRNEGGAQAVYDAYYNFAWEGPAGEMHGAKYWMLGEWGHVGLLLGDTAIKGSYTGEDFAHEMGGLLVDDFGDWDYMNDDFTFVGLAGIVEGAAFGGMGTYGDDETDVLEALAQLIGEEGGLQEYGYAAYALGLYDREEAGQASSFLMQLVLDGEFDIELDSIVEARGEALLGLASNPVPVPAAVWLLGTGLVGLVGIRRKLRK